MIKDKDLHTLYSSKKGKILYRAKWVIIGLIILVTLTAYICYTNYNEMSLEAQLNATVFGHNALTVGSILVAVILGVLLAIYLYIEHMCVKYIMVKRHNDLKQRIKNCLKVDKK